MTPVIKSIIKVASKTRKLSERWTIEANQEVRAISEDAAKQLQEEFDWIQTAHNFRQLGWHQILLTDDFDQPAVLSWVESYIEGNYASRGKQFLFERPQDAELFILKWL